MGIPEPAGAERQLYEDVFEAGPVPYLLLSPRFVIERANRAAGDLLDVPPPMLADKPLVVFVARRARAELRSALTASGTRGLTQWPTLLETRGGRVFPAHVTAVPRPQGSGGYLCTLAVREGSRPEDRGGEELDLAGGDLMGVNPDGGIRFASAGAIRALGWCDTPLSDHRLTDLWPHGGEHPVLRALARRYPLRAPRVELTRHDGTTFQAAVIAVPVEDGSGPFAVVTIREVEDVRRARVAIRERRRLADLSIAVSLALTQASTLNDLLARAAGEMVRALDVSAAGIWVREPGGGWFALEGRAGVPGAAIFATPRVRAGDGLVGGAAERGEASLTLGCPDEPALALPLSTGQDVTGVLALTGPRPLTPRAVEALRGVCRTLALGIVSQRARDLQGHDAERARHGQKMEAVGRLAGGIAHDFNNLLTVITGYGHLALEEVRSQPGVHDLVASMVQAGEVAASLTKQLLAFSRKQVLQPRVIDLNQLVDSTARMLARVLHEDIALTISTAHALWPVEADAGQLEQVLMNLVVNARDAMPEGGRLTITTANVELDADLAERLGLTSGGRAVRLRVADTGCGMDGTVAERCFEPFFTTKAAGHGTGLGLSTSYGIVRQSGGSILVASTPGTGAVFDVYLPSTDRVIPVPSNPGQMPPRAHAAETVLLVEDHDAVRGMVRHVLEREGYRVLEAHHGVAGLELSSSFDGLIDLVITDVVMPEMGGPEMARCIAWTRPGVRVLYMSGYADTQFSDGSLPSEAAFIQKPFTLDVLARRVRELLDTLPQQ